MSPSCHGALHAFSATERTRFIKYSRRPDQAGHNRLLSFALHGQNLGLKVETVRTGGFFIVFRHLTSGKETYPASRFIDTTPPKDTPGGKLVDHDFNKAYNPPLHLQSLHHVPASLAWQSPENRHPCRGSSTSTTIS
jgi:Protein of unknown function (DUF1684)